MRPALRLPALATAVLLWLAAGPAQAEVRTYVIAIGYNQPPPGSDGLRELRFADDDAAAWYTFTRDLATHATLLTVLDPDSQRRFPGLAEVARPPTLAELRRTLEWHRERFLADRKEGHDPVLLFTYSGHGSRSRGRAPSLTLVDGPLTQELLYDEVLARLPARYVHLVVDACHAEAIVRPRDLQADTVELTEDDVRKYAERTTLQRFPHVGAIVATTTAAQAHEWDAYQRGVFTHEVLSALRGAADVNADGRIEYSEVQAFLAAANREVTDPRARLNVLVRPPAVNARAPLVDLTGLRQAVRLVGPAATLGRFHVEDSLGNRLVDVRAEPSFQVAIALPAGQKVFVRSDRGEAVLIGQAGERLRIDRLTLRPAPVAVRGAVASSLRRGLFATPFGPTYYRGFIDSQSDAVGVPLPSGEVDLVEVDAGGRPALWPLWTSLGATVALGTAALTLTGLMVRARGDYEGTQLERKAADAAARFDRYRTAAIGTGVATAVAAGIGGYLLYTRVISRRGARASVAPGPGTAGIQLDLRF